MFDIINTQTDVRYRSVGIKIMKEASKNTVLKRAKLRRRLQRQRAVLRFTAALFIILSLATFSRTISSFAGEKDMDKPSYKYYTAYTVDEGDNLNSLARRYMTREYSSASRYIAEVVSINHLISASDIYAGQVLVLPYYSTEIK